MGPKRKYNNSKRSTMGNYGGGIPPGHGFHIGDHVHVHTGIHTGVKGHIKHMVGADRVHILTHSQRHVIANVKHISHIPGPKVTVS
jgi:hypothetical protein